MPESALVAIGVRFRPVEALMIRSSGEFGLGAWVKGSPIVLPTTVAGALGYAGWCIDAGCSEGQDRWGSVRECVATLIRRRFNLPVQGLDLVMRGPALLIKGKPYIATLNGLVEVSPEGLSDWVRRQKRGEVPGKRAGEVKHHHIASGRLMLARTCVGLSRTTKVSRVMPDGTGLLYTAPYVYYVFRSRNENQILRADLVVDIIIKQGEGNTPTTVRIPVRLGGEGRKALVELSLNEPALLNEVRRLWNVKDMRYSLLVLATPMILGIPNHKPLSHEEVRDLVLSTLDRYLRGVADVEEVFSVHPRVRPTVAPLQLGYDEARGRKGGIRPALMPGAVFLAKLRSGWEEVYVRGVGLHSEIGFGTLIPVPYVG